MSKHHIRTSFSIRKAHKTQLAMSKKITFEDNLPDRIRLVAGVDVAYYQDKSIGTVAVLDYESLEPVESQVSISETRFPYVPTLLSFREVPPAILSIRKLKASPDVFLVDGQGFAHPYHCGFASHLGLIINKPTIGIAKSRLIGEVENPPTKDTYSVLKYHGKVVGAAAMTKHGRRPLYVSVGHMVSLKRAIEIVSHCIGNSRVPEPILKAHEIANVEKRKINNGLETKS
jgi:deoxyribonuclease V